MTRSNTLDAVANRSSDITTSDVIRFAELLSRPNRRDFVSRIRAANGVVSFTDLTRELRPTDRDRVEDGILAFEKIGWAHPVKRQNNAKGRIGRSWQIRPEAFEEIAKFSPISVPVAFESMTRSNTLDAVVRDLEDREAVGIETYGCTVDRADLGRLDWLRHAYHEALDLALYLRRAQDEEARDDRAAGDRARDGVDRLDGVGGRLAVGSTLTVDVPRQLLAGGATMALYVAMASLADEYGVVSASVRQIAGMVEMSSTTVAKLIGTLVHDKYLQRLDQDGPSGRARYRLV